MPSKGRLFKQRSPFKNSGATGYRESPGDTAAVPSNASGYVEAAILEISKMARPRRFERPTPAFGGQYSIQLSYGRIERQVYGQRGFESIPALHQGDADSL